MRYLALLTLVTAGCEREGEPWSGTGSTATPYDASDRVWYADADSDNYGDPSATTTSATQPMGYVGNSDDCNDADSAINPDAVEVCGDDVDNDCNGLTDDEEDYLDPETTSYADVDGDGYGDASDSVFDCGTPDGYVTDSTDCDDGDSGVNPGAAEVCDSLDVDEDCDGAVDEDDPSAPFTDWYADDDDDTYGDLLDSVSACEAPADYVTDSTDCDDNDDDIYPGAEELCDMQDNDCDGSTDEDPTTGGQQIYEDDDGDGFGNESAAGYRTCAYDVTGYVNNNDDCDDSDASVNPDATEILDNGIDEDCDGADATSDTDTGVADTDTGGDTDTGADTDASMCAAGESLVSMTFEAPSWATNIKVWGEVWLESGTAKSGTSMIPQGYWTDDSPVTGLMVDVTGTTVTVTYDTCVDDDANWYMTFEFETSSGAGYWSCVGSGTLYGTLTAFRDEGTVDEEEAIVSTYLKSTGGCELTF